MPCHMFSWENIFHFPLDYVLGAKSKVWEGGSQHTCEILRGSFLPAFETKLQHVKKKLTCGHWTCTQIDFLCDICTCKLVHVSICDGFQASSPGVQHEDPPSQPPPQKTTVEALGHKGHTFVFQQE